MNPSPSPPQQPGGGCLALVLVFGLVIGAGIAFGGATLLWQTPSAWKQMQEVWTETPGTVLSSRVQEREVRTGNQPQNYKTSTLYHVELDYSYELKGQRHTGTAPAARQPEQEGNLEQATVIALEYQPGHPVSVFYNPKDHATSRLVAEGPNGLFWIGLFGGPLLILSGAGLGWWSWLDWKAKRKAAAGT
ncbi:uncharacterized protein DUF3592 [Roseimicrobium gellanilyticum]|uniref:Uncharacterized protein DUF3592 n=1 Tax=Roseimicrobium gellanilyticum TaxID=748857 RepID=A0A366HND1_9BACT|nr:DUF3592 domain-containing protein [Roseimicrobium gellanilyticum]RBP44286.1 uncharacterized protein DUF3592 [Roseimicrobium gellanilyticum]